MFAPGFAPGFAPVFAPELRLGPPPRLTSQGRVSASIDRRFRMLESDGHMTQVSRAIDVQVGASTDTGLTRIRNEDRFRADSRVGLFLVVDGVGGQNAGEVASDAVAVAIDRFIKDTSDDDDAKTWPFDIDLTLSDAGNRLRVAILVANQTLADRIARDDGVAGMAATMAAALLEPPRAVVANVGDCRGYLLRDGVLIQLTTDHSWVAEQVRLGILDKEAARHHPMRNVVTRALAGHEQLEIDLVEFSVQAGDTLLLCSDGLSGMVSDEDIRRHLVEWLSDPQEACGRLVRAANEGGGKDNVTVIVVTIGGSLIAPVT